MPTNAKKIRIGGVSHDIEDTQARTDISALKSSTDYLVYTQPNNIYDLDKQQIYTPWEQGSMDGGSGGPLDDRLTNIRSKDYIYLDSGVYKFSCPSTERFYLFRYAFSDKSYTDAPVWGRNSDYYLSVTTPIYVKMVEAHANGANISPSDALVVINREITKLASTISSELLLDDIVYGLGNNKIKPSQILNLENYSINDGGIGRTSNVRYLSQLFIEFPTSLILVPKTNSYQYAFYSYNSDGTGATTAGWKTGVRTEFLANSLYSIVFIKAGSQAGELLTVDEIDNAFSFIIKTQIKQKNKRVFCVSHQGNTSIDSNNHNKAEGYKNAKICGFEYAETDLKYTSDGVLVCCHDTTFEDATTGETVQISNTTLANLKTHNYYGGTIATLSEILSVCKTYGLKLFVDQIGNATYANALISVLNKMRAWDDVIINIGYNETTIANIIMTANKNATLAVVSSSATLTDLITFATSIKTDDNTVYISANVSQLPIANIEALNETIPANIGLMVWMLDTVANVLNYLPYINGYTTNLISYDDVYNTL